MYTHTTSFVTSKIAIAVATVLVCSTIQASTSFDELTQTHTWKDADNGNAVHFRGNSNDSTPELKNGQNIKLLNTSSRWLLGDYSKDFSYQLDKISFTNKPSDGGHKFFAIVDGSDNNNFNPLDPKKTYLTINELRLGLNTALQLSGNITDKTADIRRLVITKDIAEGQTIDQYDILKNAVNIQMWANAYGHVTGTSSSMKLKDVVVEDGASVTFSAKDNEKFAQASSLSLSKITLGDKAQVLSGYAYGYGGNPGGWAIGTTRFDNVVANGDSTITIDNGTLTLGSLEVAENKHLSITANQKSVVNAQTPASVAGINDTLAVSLAGKSTLSFDTPTVEKTTMTITTAAKAPGQVQLGEKATLKGDSISVVSGGTQSTGNTLNDLNALAGVVVDSKKDHVAGVHVTQEANELFDAASGITTAQGGVTDVKVEANASIHGIAEMTALGLMVWRSEINDMNKRLGELRDSSEQSNGVWARVYNGKAKYGAQNVTNKYTAFQFGYDRQVTPGVWLGGAMSYTDGKNDFKQGNGDSSLYAFTGYASWLAENGMFVDVTGKFGRMKNSFDIATNLGTSSGSYRTNTVSMSAEAGWRLYPMQNALYVEPQVEMMYGRVFSADYTTSLGVNVDQASTDTLVGRVGFALGLKCPDNRGNAYVRASVLHDWKGDASATFTKNGLTRTVEDDLGDTWIEYGIGANYNATKNVHLYVDLESTASATVETSYRFNIGARYAF